MGRHLHSKLKASGSGDAVTLTSRTDPGLHRFDLQDQKTWAELPKADVTIWTFPAVPLDLVQQFIQNRRQSLGQIVVIGTTGVLEPDQLHGWVSESTSWSDLEPRATGEKFLVNEGANIVLSAGIYGPEKNPENWYKKGLVGPSEKYVNLIHVEDLSNIVLAAAMAKLRGQTFIASDNSPRTWAEIFSEMGWGAGPSAKAKSPRGGRVSKRVNSTHTLKELKIELIHRDILSSLKAGLK